MPKTTFKAFLSHRYKSPQVNQRFFELLSSHANVAFAVDVGTKATNVTRLERFVRDADAFVGIYPYPSGEDTRPDLNTAIKASRYFRLELDLAARSRRPAIVFVDGRYGTAVTVPTTIHQCRYDHPEAITTPSQSFVGRLDRAAKTFFDEVTSGIRLRAARGHSVERDRVGILLPAQRTWGYSKREIERLEHHLKGMSLSPVRLDWQRGVDGAFLRELETLDWAIVDIGSEACLTGLPAFLHGHFVPQMRLMRLGKDIDALSPLETTLLAPFEVGYPKDIIRWRDGKELEREFVQRLTTLYEPRKYVSDLAEARKYFAGASLRNEPVFLSYSGEDRDFAATLASALRQRFQQVFDYRDEGKSIVPGRRWMEEIFDKLSTSAIAIPLLSPSYVKSGYCRHEAQEMMSLADADKLVVIPVNLKEGTKPPSWIRAIEYIRLWQVPKVEELVEKIISAYDAVRAGRRAR